MSLVASANAAVAGLGFVGSGLLLPLTLDHRGFVAVSLFLAAFQCLQEVMGRSLNWALLRAYPIAARERPEGGPQMLSAAWALQRRLIAFGCLVALVLALVAHGVLDTSNEPSRALMLALATLAAGFGVVLQFDLGVLQLRERFLAFSGWMVANSAARLLAWALLWATGLLSLTTAVAAHIATAALIALASRRAAGSIEAPDRTPQSQADRARLLAFGGKMVVATALASTAAQVDLFLLDARADDAATGRLRIAVLFASVLELATSAAMIALLPQAGRAASAADRKALLRRSAACGGIIAALAVGSLPVVQFALPRLLPNYAEATQLYPIVLLGVVCTALTDPVGLGFISRDRPGRFVLLNATMLLVVVFGNLLAPGDDRAVVTAWVRSCGRIVLALGILAFVIRDVRRARTAADAAC